MERQDVFTLTAPCGIDCFNCELLEANLTDDLRASVAGRAPAARPRRSGCQGCRTQGCPIFAEACPTRACVAERGIFVLLAVRSISACGRLLPSPQALGRFPHNMKLYNLCRIQAVGLHRWAEEEAAGIRRLYFRGTVQARRMDRFLDASRRSSADFLIVDCVDLIWRFLD